MEKHQKKSETSQNEKKSITNFSTKPKAEYWMKTDNEHMEKIKSL